MRLAKLTLSGFKSFADATEFTFDQAITGIVGPNGCGKSNVVDAIKWVLGERSSKSLRGTEMLDVIFAGSAARKPAGMASVTLTFENPVGAGSPAMVQTLDAERGEEVAAREKSSHAAGEAAGVSGDDAASLAVVDGAAGEAEEEASVLDLRVKSRRALPIDADLVEIERRLYRDGTSQYLINGKRARLRDIRELFMDTGIGADAYSIIEQGKVDAMLLASPQERRVIFEEAAGIAKYKQRRIEAQRKLDRAMTNLVGTREQLESTERRLRLVRGQAAKARRFKDLDEQLRALRTALAFEQYDELRQRLDGLTSRQAELETVRSEAQSVLAETEVAKQDAELKRGELQNRHRTAEQERMRLAFAASQASQRREMTLRSVQEARTRSEQDAARLTRLRESLMSVEAGFTAQSEDVAALAERRQECERTLSTAAQERAGVLEALNELQATANQKRSALARIDRDRSGLLASLAAEERQANQVREQIERLEVKHASAGADLDALKQKAAASATLAGELAEAAGTLEASVKSTQSRLELLGQGRTERSKALSQAEQEFARTESRRVTLQEMAESRVGYAEAVRVVMAKREEAQARATQRAARIAQDGTSSEAIAEHADDAALLRIPGPLVDLIRVEGELAGSVEAALGPMLQALVTPGLEALPSRGWLATLPGRVTFVPLRAPGEQARGADESAVDPVIASRVTRLAGVVAVREGATPHAEALRGMLDRVLGTTYLVEDLDTAGLLAASGSFGAQARFVTRDGSVLEADGRVIAGPIAASQESGAGLLARHQELERVTQLAVELAAARDAARAQLAAVDSEAAEVSTLVARLRDELTTAQRRAIAEQNTHSRLEADAARAARDVQQAQNEIAHQRERLERAQREQASLRERADSLGRLADEQTAGIKEAEESLRGAQARAESAAEQLTAAKVEVGRLVESLNSARRELTRLEVSRDDLTRQIRDVSASVEHAAGRIAELEATAAEAEAQIVTAGAQAAEHAALAESLATELNEASDTLVKLVQRLDAARQHAMHLERDWNSLEISRRELEVKRETMEERAMDELKLDLSREYADYRGLFEPAMIAADTDAAESDGSGEDRGESDSKPAAGELWTVGRIDPASTQKDIDILRDEIRKLGSVNLESIEEEGTLQTQNVQLVKQVADLDSAKTMLEGLIAQLNEVSRARFGEVFTKIQQNFGSETGMFRRLFGGGKAEVRLMPLMKEVENPDGSVSKVETDVTDLLESGVEVIAKPPGKEPRSISQLSGGEKTLTAVALLMAIFRSKPSCFCVLDEVDAALDEGNVMRFGNVVRQYTDLSHFIVITHNKRTMQQADRLFGVTMQERGVSTRVSVRFDQVGKDGTITESSPKREHAAAANTSPALAHPEAPEVVIPPVATPAQSTEEPRPRVGPLRRALAAMREETQAAESRVVQSDRE